MSKEFNVTGKCIAAKHYMADVSAKMADTVKLVEKGNYFIINCPRQYGKTTTLYGLADANSGILYGHASEIDILFKDATNFWYIDTASTATIPVNRIDFYSVCLHEQGHGHRLGHVVETDKVMFWGLAPQVRQRNLHAADIAGGINVVDYSVIQRPPYNAAICKPTPMQRVTSSACNTVTNAYEIHQQNEFNINHHPNPAFDHQMITFDLPSSQSVGIGVYNLIGDLVIEQQTIKYGAGNHTVRLNCAELPEGIYILQLTINSNKYATKFVKSY
ncbi:MAG: hypothetical protein RIS64_1175 [Bacteroidota bacterium]|jgi:hypothetical protein